MVLNVEGCLWATVASTNALKRFLVVEVGSQEPRIPAVSALINGGWLVLKAMPFPFRQLEIVTHTEFLNKA